MSVLPRYALFAVAVSAASLAFHLLTRGDAT